jgi:hypothetical protein
VAQSALEQPGPVLSCSKLADIFWSQRLRVTLNCAMNFERMPCAPVHFISGSPYKPTGGSPYKTNGDSPYKTNAHG